jgi:small conductance mechanosensitive channel
MMPLPFQDEATAAVTEAAPDALERVRELAVQYGERVAFAVAILAVGWFVARLFTNAVRKALERAHVDVTLARFLGNLAQMLAMTFVIVAAISKLGVETASFVAVLGAAGFAVGFALQGSLSNFAAGVMIMFFRPFKAGDMVDAGGTSGVVDEVGIFSTVVLTPDNKRVIVANSAITGNNITNYSAMPTRRVDLEFGVGYGDDLKRAKQLILDVLARDARVLKQPAPVVAVGKLGDSSVSILCRPWVATADYWAVSWDTLENVKRAFDENGVTIPFPQRDVHLHQVA